MVNGKCRDGARSKSGVSRVEVDVAVESRAGTGWGPKRGSFRARTSPGSEIGSWQGRGVCLALSQDIDLAGSQSDQKSRRAGA